MKTVNEMKLTIESRSSNESFARVAVTAFVAGLDPTIEEINDIRTCVSEAVTNCIVHAYKENLGKIYITVSLSEDALVTIKIRDRGCGIADVERAVEPLFTTDPDGERSGMGFTVMENFMDSMSVKSTVGKGTRVTMRKKLSSLPVKK